MPLPMPISAGDSVIQAQLPNITAASLVFFPVTRTGRVKRMSACPSVVTATGAATVQLAYAQPGSSTFTNIVGGLISIPAATAAGVSVSTDLAPASDTYVQDGGVIRATLGGTATGGGVPQLAINIGV